MNPMKYQDEKQYYIELLEKFDENVIQQQQDFDTFFAKEIIEIMQELKQEKENVPLMETIAKNMILILLSFYHEQRNCQEFRAFCDLEENDQSQIKNCFLTLL